MRVQKEAEICKSDAFTPTTFNRVENFEDGFREQASEEMGGEHHDEKIIELWLTCKPEEDTNLIELKVVENGDDAIREDDPEAVELMVDYLYLGDYDPNSITEDPPCESSDDVSGRVVERSTAM
ncbi:hypothetical protein LTR49_028293 [Elasticomyces elasticus]|nr:hypothetical protein LTR49_028293 [Elasticomyces elasticus]